MRLTLALSLILIPLTSSAKYNDPRIADAIYQYVEGEEKKPVFSPADMVWESRNNGDFLYDVFTYEFPRGHKWAGQDYDFGIVFFCKKHKAWEAAGLFNIITPLGTFPTREGAKAAVVSAAWYSYWETVKRMNQPPEQEG